MSTWNWLVIAALSEGADVRAYLADSLELGPRAAVHFFLGADA